MLVTCVERAAVDGIDAGMGCVAIIKCEASIHGVCIAKRRIACDTKLRISDMSYQRKSLPEMEVTKPRGFGTAYTATVFAHFGSITTCPAE